MDEEGGAAPAAKPGKKSKGPQVGGVKGPCISPHQHHCPSVSPCGRPAPLPTSCVSRAASAAAATVCSCCHLPPLSPAVRGRAGAGAEEGPVRPLRAAARLQLALPLHHPGVQHLLHHGHAPQGVCVWVCVRACAEGGKGAAAAFGPHIAVPARPPAGLPPAALVAPMQGGSCTAMLPLLAPLPLTLPAAACPPRPRPPTPPTHHHTQDGGIAPLPEPSGEEQAHLPRVIRALVQRRRTVKDLIKSERDPVGAVRSGRWHHQR